MSTQTPQEIWDGLDWAHRECLLDHPDNRHFYNHERREELRQMGLLDVDHNETDAGFKVAEYGREHS